MPFVSQVSPEFWEQYNELPAEVQNLSNKAYRLFLADPWHPSLALKKVGPFWSARISLGYRVVGYRRNNEFFWFWIGSHAEYDRLLRG